jgi:predicted amidohydrolase
MASGSVRVATCQFAVSGSLARNAAMVHRQIDQAVRRRAQVAHFPEAALTGYAGVDLPTPWDGYDWDGLDAAHRAMAEHARRKRVWIVFGSAHRLTGDHRPHNCLYALDPRGRIVERYDKRFCTAGDLQAYSCGDHLSVFSINGVRCGLLICYDVRFPELYRAYRKRQVQLMFHSFYNARAEPGPNVHTAIMRASLQARAATNYTWISGNNASGYYQSWPSVLVQPDGRIAGSLPRHRAGVMVHTVNTRANHYDASAPFRSEAMAGQLCSTRPVSDVRSRRRQSF